MNEFVYKLTLDLNCTKTPPVICSGQFDKGRKFEFTITANGEPYDVTGCSAVLKGVRSNGSHFAVDCAISDSKIIKVLDDTTLSVRGMTAAKLVISDSAKSYSTQKFVIDVDSALDGDITVADDYSILNRLIEQIHALNESGAILIDNTINMNSNNAVANRAVATALANKTNKTTTTVLFNADKIPIKVSTGTTLAAGFATNNIKLVTAFISNNITAIQSGAFSGCSNLTDVYIDSTPDNIVIASGAIPNTATIHYSDNVSIVDYLVNAIMTTNITMSSKLDNAEGSVTRDNIDVNAVGTEEIDSGAVDTINIADNAVTADKIADKAVTNGKIANGAITATKIAVGAVSSNNIAQGQINTGHMQNGAVTIDKLAGGVKTSINGKADKATTLAGYGITDGENIGNKVAEKGSVTDESINYPSIKYLNNYYYDFDEVNDLLSEKYNASNVETGSGTLTPYNENMSNKINSASFNYQRSGAYVTVSVYIDFKAFTVDNAGINIMLLGLPYVCKNAVNPRELCVTTSKQQMIYAVTANTSNLTLLFFNTGAFTENEKLSFTVTYKIS